MGALVDIGMLIAGMLAGVLRFRGPIARAWSGAGRATSWKARLLIAYVYALVFFAVVRAAGVWIEMQLLYFRFHVREHLVPQGPEGIVLQFFVTAQAILVFVVVARAARAFAYRRAPTAGPAITVVMLGAALALACFLVLYLATPKPPMYWRRSLLVDHAAYGVISLAGALALHVLARVERSAPPIAAVAIEKATRDETNGARGLELAGAALALVALGHAFVSARKTYRFHQALAGEIPMSSDFAAPQRGADDCRAMFWMPDDDIYKTEGTVDTPFGTRHTTRYEAEYADVRFVLTCWSPASTDRRPLAELCGADFTVTSATTCERSRPAEDVLDRLVYDGHVVFQLRAENPSDPAARYFFDSFRTLPEHD